MWCQPLYSTNLKSLFAVMVFPVSSQTTCRNLPVSSIWTNAPVPWQFWRRTCFFWVSYMVSGRMVQKDTDHWCSNGVFLSGLSPPMTSITSPKSKKTPQSLYSPLPFGSRCGSPHWTKKSSVQAELIVTLSLANFSHKIISSGFYIMSVHILAPSLVVDISPNAMISFTDCKIPEK